MWLYIDPLNYSLYILITYKKPWWKIQNYKPFHQQQAVTCSSWRSFQCWIWRGAWFGWFVWHFWLCMGAWQVRSMDTGLLSNQVFSRIYNRLNKSDFIKGVLLLDIYLHLSASFVSFLNLLTLLQKVSTTWCFCLFSLFICFKRIDLVCGIRWR